MRKVLPSDATSNELPAGPLSSDRALQLLTAAGTAPNGSSLTELATQVGLIPSTALRQLRSLEAAGLLERSDADQLYRPGPALVRLAAVVFTGSSLAATAAPFLESVARTVGESVYLAIATGPRRAAYLASSPGIHALRHTGWVGQEFTSTGTATGAALRARVDPDGTVVRVGRLEPGITAVAATVRAAHGIAGAINLVGPSFRLEGTTLARARTAVASAAEHLSDALTPRSAAPTSPER